MIQRARLVILARIHSLQNLRKLSGFYADSPGTHRFSWQSYQYSSTAAFSPPGVEWSCTSEEMAWSQPLKKSGRCR